MAAAAPAGLYLVPSAAKAARTAGQALVDAATHPIASRETTATWNGREWVPASKVSRVNITPAALAGGAIAAWVLGLGLRPQVQEERNPAWDRWAAQQYGPFDPAHPRPTDPEPPRTLIKTRVGLVERPRGFFNGLGWGSAGGAPLAATRDALTRPPTGFFKWLLDPLGVNRK